MAARVSVSSRSMRRLRVSAGLTRWVLYATATAGLAASARFAIAPPHAPAAPAPVVERRDLAAEGFASQLARSYLTFDGDRPDAHRAQLAPFVGDQLDPDLGLRAPPGRVQRVRWTADRAVATGRRRLARLHRRRANRSRRPALSQRRRRPRPRPCPAPRRLPRARRRPAQRTRQPRRRKEACATSRIAACAPHASARCATTSRARETTSTPI